MRFQGQRWLGVAVLAALAIVALAVVACGDDGSAEVAGTSGGEPLSGNIAVDGSSTVFPVTEAAAEEFRFIEPDVRVNVAVSGTGGGFQRFCRGETDISNASRPVSDSERELCEQNGVEWIELRVGLDGLAVVAHPDNDFLTCITTDELRAIWAPEAEGQVRRWSQVRAEWPDREIRLYGPGTNSGTFDFFTEEVVGEVKASRADYTASEDDNTLVLGVAGSPDALGYFGYAYYAENQGRLKIVEVDAGEGCVAPSDATVGDGTYPLARPLFLYVNTGSLSEKPHVREFVRFYLSDDGISLVPAVGYTAIPEDEVEESRAKLEAAIGG